MVMDESKYCTGCGKAIEPGMQFCPQCGLVVSGSAADEEFKEREKKIGEILLESRRNWLVFLLAIYAIPAIIASIISLVDAPSAAASIFQSDAFQTWLTDHGLHYTQADIQNFITTGAAMSLLSGICASVSLLCVYTRKRWIVAVITCFAAAILCFWSVFGIIIGFLVAWMVMGSKDIFLDQPVQTDEKE